MISRSFCRTMAPNEKILQGTIFTVEYHHAIMSTGFIISGVDSCGRISAVSQMIHFLAC
jgi:hypothetical protein